MELTTVLFLFSFPFVLLTAYFGTKSDFYESDNYKGDGCAHDVKRVIDSGILSSAGHGKPCTNLPGPSGKAKYSCETNSELVP